MTHLQVRDYFRERLIHTLRDWRIFQISEEQPSRALSLHSDTDIHRLEKGIKYSFTSEDKNKAYQSEASNIIDFLKNRNQERGFPAEFYFPVEIDAFPPNRIPPSGIIPLPFQYARSHIVTATEKVPETGFAVHPRILRLIQSKYPQFMIHISKYVRPLGTTDATMLDFFKPQRIVDPLDPDRANQVLKILKHFMDIPPYQPVHFIDSLYDKAPLHTGTGYFNRHSFKINAHATFSHPEEYASKHTSKGYYINAFLEHARTWTHYIKLNGLPFADSVLHKDHSLKNFILKRPTMIFTRNHISDREGILKQRPVYCVDDLFLRLESMITFPAHVLARRPSCCIMYGFETIRGSNHMIDKIAQNFNSYFTIDWSGFDQRAPHVITDLFWTNYLPSLLIVSHGYAPTYDYPSYPDLTTPKLASPVMNIISFLHTWFENMVFISADGYAYSRTTAGVPSGMLNTQFIDSFVNLYLIIDGFLEFGCSVDEIYEVILLIMGDDNSGFTIWSIARLEEFIIFFEKYALDRYNMILSKSKSIITTLRNRIETLSYQCNFGYPKRPLGKLVAQLCYPERGPRPKFTSARAIGLAYAACGMDKTFHDLCRDIYYEFIDDAVDPEDPDTFQAIQEYLPGYMRVDETLRDQISLTSFPSLQQVLDHISKWQGPLSFFPKWDRAHFINDPDHIQENFVTLEQYMKSNNLEFPDIPTLWL